MIGRWFLPFDCGRFASSRARFEIAKAASVTVVSIVGGPFTYTGAAQTPATVSVTGAGGLSLTPTADYLNKTNAGTATASYSYAGDANHEASSDSKAPDLVKLRFFAGLTMSEAADVLGMSVRSAHDVWAYARVWLHRALRPD